VWKYDLINNYWSQIDPPNFVPSARSHHGSSIVLGDTIVIFGGKNADGFLNDMYLYNMYTNRWVAVDMPNMPSARASPCVAYYYPNLYIYGGENENGELDDFWNYSFNDQTLVQIDTGGFQPLRHSREDFLLHPRTVSMDLPKRFRRKDNPIRELFYSFHVIKPGAFWWKKNYSSFFKYNNYELPKFSF
jgi:hypothetical protein